MGTSTFWSSDYGILEMKIVGLVIMGIAAFGPNLT
jgi:hypothetical protein